MRGEQLTAQTCAAWDALGWGERVILNACLLDAELGGLGLADMALDLARLQGTG